MAVLREPCDEYMGAGSTWSPPGIDAGSIFTLNVYPEPFTRAGVAAKGFKSLCGDARMFVGRGFSHDINSAEYVRLY
jgi:hypothetical protein